MSEVTFSRPLDAPLPPQIVELPRTMINPAIARVGLRLAGCVLAVGAAASPMAVEYGLEHAQIHDAIGQFPTTFSFTHDGLSSLQSGLVNGYLPRTEHGLGLEADVRGLPPTAKPADFLTPAYWKTTLGLYGDPRQAVDIYKGLLIDDAVDKGGDWLKVAAGIGGVAALGAGQIIYKKSGSRLSKVTIAKVTAGAFVASSLFSSYQLHEWGANEYVPQHFYRVDNLAGTPLDGLEVDSKLSETAIEQAKPTIDRFLARQEAQDEEFTRTMMSLLPEQLKKLEAPREGEHAFFIQSDMHSNAICTKEEGIVIKYYVDHFPGAAKADLDDGDRTYGTASGGTAIKAQSEAADGLAEGDVEGNHKTPTDINTKQEEAAGINVIDGTTDKVGGIRVAGVSDPRTTEFLGTDTFKDGKTEEDAGIEARKLAEKDHPDILLLHEPEALAAMLGVPDLDAYMEAHRNDDPFTDNDNNLPMKMAAVGHEHTEVDPVVIYNADGTWTVIFKLGTAGGAIPNPTPGNISLPQAVPKQTASFMLVFRNDETGLITGYQRVRLYPDGHPEVLPRVDFGNPGGHPYPVSGAAAHGKPGRISKADERRDERQLVGAH